MAVSAEDGPVSEIDTRLRDRLEQGAPLRLSKNLPDWKPSDATEPPSRLVVPSDEIRQLLCDQEASADPRGVALVGAIITGVLDLTQATVNYPFGLYYCRLCFSKQHLTETLRAAVAPHHRPVSHVANSSGVGV